MKNVTNTKQDTTASISILALTAVLFIGCSSSTATNTAVLNNPAPVMSISQDAKGGAILQESSGGVLADK